MTINASMIITFGGVLAVVVTVVKMGLAVYDFVKHNKEQDAKIERIEQKQERILEENELIIDGLHACLDGLHQLKCNHTVPETKERLYKYLNKEAHK